MEVLAVVLALCTLIQVSGLKKRMARLDARDEKESEAKRERMVREQLDSFMGTRCIIQYAVSYAECEATPIDMDDAWVLMRIHERGTFRARTSTELIRISAILSVRAQEQVDVGQKPEPPAEPAEGKDRGALAD